MFNQRKARHVMNGWTRARTHAFAHTHELGARNARMMAAFNTAVSVNHLWFSPYLSLCLCAFDGRN